MYKRSPLAFFALVFGLSVPFWLMAAATDLQISWMLFPVGGSHFDMRLGGLGMFFTAAVVTVVWGRRRWLDSRTPDRAQRCDPSKRCC